MTKYLKAIIGALVAALGALSAALADNGVTPQEWVTVITTFLVAGGAVFAVPNKADPTAAPTPDVAAMMASAVADYERSLTAVRTIANAVALPVFTTPAPTLTVTNPTFTDPPVTGG